MIPKSTICIFRLSHVGSEKIKEKRPLSLTFPVNNRASLTDQIEHSGEMSVIVKRLQKKLMIF